MKTLMKMIGCTLLTCSIACNPNNVGDIQANEPSCADRTEINALREQLLDQREASIAQRERQLAIDEERFTEGKRLIRSILLDALPRMTNDLERLDLHGEHRHQIAELRRTILLLEERQRNERSR